MGNAPQRAGGFGLPHGGTAVLEVIPLPGRPGIRARGEISSVTRSPWEEALAGLARRHADVSYVELSEVGFVDVAGVAALAVTALDLRGGRVVVEHPPPQVSRVLSLFWPGLRRIEVSPR
ncbi:STAS domain-containing protein [Streptomyces sp. ID05-04B]|uniref:STAS domain-containing protein n=1 Tax=unclassified Streptomyces TaxID=2593676 RepID=UPI0020B1456F|nr:MULTISPECIES: STAS domain-containing protein [unclassified Streptomyces]MDX5570187.1 STAS domain-containing protein [Streptomyces sp. ID05-04B]